MIGMGYIPPVRDEQMMIYGNRQQKTSPSIPPTAAVQRAVFYEALQNRFHSGNYFERNVKKHQLDNKAKKLENNVTGKGTYFDKSI